MGAKRQKINPLIIFYLINSKATFDKAQFSLLHPSPISIPYRLTTINQKGNRHGSQQQKTRSQLFQSKLATIHARCVEDWQWKLIQY
jgi:hypothetical protein